MKKRTVRLILDCMICDAMSPEFKKANDILLRIIKTNDRTDGLPHTRLAELNRAFKANDPKAAKIAYALRACAGEMPVDSVSRKFYVVAKNVSNGNLTDDMRSLFMKAKAEAGAYKDMDNWETIKSVFNRAAAAIRNMQSRVDSTYDPPAPYEKRQVLTYVGGNNDADKYRGYERDTIEKLFGAKRNKLRELARKVSEIIPIKISESNLRLVSEKRIGKDIAEYLRKEVEKYREKPDAPEDND